MLMDVPAFFLALFLLNKIGRKTMLAACMLIGGSSCSITMLTTVFGGKGNIDYHNIFPSLAGQKWSVVALLCSTKYHFYTPVLKIWHGRPSVNNIQDIFMIIEPVPEITNNLVCATSKASDQPAHTRSLIRAFASRLSIL